ncbi:MAG: hypothetical protein ACYCVH_10310 [Ignavibacteriaceae bacterium]
MNKFSLVIFLIFTISLVTLQSCKSPTGPVELQPGRRDYTWTVDTLNIPYTVLESIWGSSPSDVWCVGPGGDKDKTIYHFNGQKWVNDGISRSLSPTAVFGFSASNVWFGSYGNTIWHYDGNNISRFQDYTIPNYPYAGIQNIWGDSPNNVYAVGFADSSNIHKGILQHFDGSKWEVVYESSPHEVFMKIYRGLLTSSNYYILSYKDDNNHLDTSIVYEFDNRNMKKIYLSEIINGFSSDLAVVNSEVYFILNNGVYLLNKSWLNTNSGFKLLFNVNNSNFSGGIGGRNRNDIFLLMRDGIAHYNGMDIQYLYHFDHSKINLLGNPVIFDKEIFFLAYDFQNNLNLIIRGKLKE